MNWNTVFNSALYSLSRFDPKRIFKQDILINWQKEVLNTKWRETQFSTPNCVLSANLMQNAFLRKVSLKFGKTISYNKMTWNTFFSSELYSLRRFDAKGTFLGRNPYPLEKESFQHKMTWNTVFNTELCSFSRLDAKRIFKEDILKISQIEDFNINEVKHSLQQRVVFFEQIGCKTYFLARYPYNLGKRSFEHKMKWNTVFNSELYSLRRFHAKRTF